MIGSTKFPSTAGIDGIRKNQTMITPWAVNSLLYAAWPTSPPAGVRRWMRSRVAASPPSTNISLIETM